MRIIRTETDLYEEKVINNEKSGGYCFLMTKTPAVAVIGGNELILGVNSAVVFSKDNIRIKPINDNAQLSFDYMIFSINAFGAQYIEALGISVDMPFEIYDDTVIRSVFRCVSSQSFSDESRKNQFHESAVHMLLIAVSEQISAEISLPSSDIPHYKELFSLRNNIYAEPVKEWSIDEICNRLGISNTYFHRIYFAAFGITCRQDVINSRLALAEKLLVNTDRSIGSIAEQCGYDNDSYFMRQFKKHRGYTPTEYRRKFDKNVPDGRFD